MTVTLMKSKIHRATVTEANLNYIGSVTVDADLMRSAGLYEFELVHVLDLDNGNRLQTYVIPGPPGEGGICMNGAAARLVHVGDRVIILAYCQVEAEEAPRHRPRILLIGEDNALVSVVSGENSNETFFGPSGDD